MLPAGLIGIAASFLGRYREFDQALSKTLIPTNTRTEWYLGLNVAFAFNQLVRVMLNDPILQWIWFLGDDHIWAPSLLENLIRRNVPVVSPLVTKHAPPFDLILKRFTGGLSDKGLEHLSWNFLKGKTGLLRLDNMAVGNAGLLVQREVFENIPEPWFTVGYFAPDLGSPDLYFCHLLRTYDIPIYLDTDNTIGHMTHVASFPKRNPDGTYGSDLAYVGVNPG